MVRSFAARCGLFLLACAAIFRAAVLVADATETGGGVYPNGTEDAFTAITPPPGAYFFSLFEDYHATRFTAGSGKADLIPAFRADAVSEALRFAQWDRRKLFGAQIGHQVIAPFVSLDVSAAGASQHKSGVGDVALDPFILSFQGQRVHLVVSPEFNLPTGAYTKGDLANIGRNYFNYEQILGVTLTPTAALEASAKIMYDINASNPDTNYKSGQELHIDYDAGYHRGFAMLSVGGYYYVQTTNDTQNGIKVGPDGFRGRVFAIGPHVMLPLGHGFATLKWHHEMGAMYRPEGSKYDLKVLIPL